MTLEFKLPDIGEGIAEGEIVKWLVKPGEAVKEHQPVVEVMTDKATVEIPAPRAGRIKEIRAKEGEVVPVGHVLFLLETPDSGISSEPVAPEKKHVKENAEPKAARDRDRSSGGSIAPRPRELAFRLPDIGEGIAEGEIVRWLAAEGERVLEHQPVVEVMTDKATVEIPSPANGILKSIKAQPGAVVPIGAILFELEALENSISAASSHPPHEVAMRQEAAGEAVARPPANPKNIRAVPSARRVARELGIDLAQIKGSGRGGVIRRKDVEAPQDVEAGPGPAAIASTPGRSSGPVDRPLADGDRETRTPFRGVRRKIAEAMSRSKATAAHFTVVEELDVSELVRLRETAKKIGDEAQVKVTYLPFIMKATALALAKHPELNGMLDEKQQELVTFHYVNLGIATDTPQGLLVPVIREVQAKGILKLAEELNDLADRSRKGKIKPEELQGGTFTITNAGNIGGILATPIINFPEIAILGVHRIVKRPGVVTAPEGDKIEIRQYMHLSVSVDHRLTDGANAARFLVTMKQLLEVPGLLAL